MLKFLRPFPGHPPFRFASLTAERHSSWASCLKIEIGDFFLTSIGNWAKPAMNTGTKIIYLGFEKSQRTVTHDFLRYINILTYLLTYLNREPSRCIGNNDYKSGSAAYWVGPAFSIDILLNISYNNRRWEALCFGSSVKVRQWII